MDKCGLFHKELHCIKADDLRGCVAEILMHSVPLEFYEIPASSSGKYHPWYALGYGGLVRHTKAAVKIAVDLLSLEQNQYLSSDEIIAALILHDCYKSGTEYAFDHPKLAADDVRDFADFIDDKSLKLRLYLVASLIESHMGQWNHSKDYVLTLPKPISDNHKFVHMCDYLASRKYIVVEVE